MRKKDVDEQILRASKEIVVKFIETGRISPTGFPDVFKSIYRTVDETVKQATSVEVNDAGDGEES
jgi:predicted transcriptional regulator